MVFAKRIGNKCSRKKGKFTNEREWIDLNAGGDSQIHDWQEGRRVASLAVLAEKLQNGCHACTAKLQLINIIDERIYGLGSVLKIKCFKCKTITNVETDTRIKGKDQEKGEAAFVSNKKIASGMFVFNGLLFMGGEWNQK